MQQRYYDPGIGRFLSNDPVTTNPTDGSNFGRYRYAANNPYRFVDPDGRYEQDVHRDLTFVLAQAAGLSVDTSAQIALSDQGVDENPATSPMGMSPFGESVRVRADYHFTDASRRDAMFRQFTASGSPAALGRYLHALQDSFSHEGYGPKVGHLLDEHAPDKTYNNPDKADAMARTTYNILVNSRGTFGSSGSALPWRRISSLVRQFNGATTDKGKQEALTKLRKEVKAAELRAMIN